MDREERGGEAVMCLATTGFVLTLAAAPLACRTHDEPRIGATPVSESLDAQVDVVATDAAIATSIDAAIDAAIDATVAAIDPCEQWGPAIGDPCDASATLCLSLASEPLYERRCEAGTWKHHVAHALPKTPLGACPTSWPRSGDPCTGARSCSFGGCAPIDPTTGEPMFVAWASTWVCYDGAWQRREERCIGE